MRKWRAKVAAYSDFGNEGYIARIVGVCKGGGAQMLFSLEHQDEEQRGRTTEVAASLPIRPNGLAAQIFAACGQEVRVGATIEPEACIGHRIRVFMEKDVVSGQWQVARATRLEEVSHGQ